MLPGLEDFSAEWVLPDRAWPSSDCFFQDNSPRTLLLLEMSLEGLVSSSLEESLPSLKLKLPRRRVTFDRGLGLRLQLLNPCVCVWGGGVSMVYRSTCKLQYGVYMGQLKKLPDQILFFNRHVTITDHFLTDTCRLQMLGAQACGPSHKCLSELSQDRSCIRI